MIVAAGGDLGECAHMNNSKMSPYDDILADNMTDIVSLFEDERMVDISPSVKRVLGYSAEEFLSLDHIALIHPEDRERVVSRIRERIRCRTREPHRFLYRQQAKDGTYRWIETIQTAKYFSAESVTTILNSRDVTDRVEVEQALRASEEKYRLLAEASVDIIYALDGCFAPTYISPAVDHVLGYGPAELYRRSIFDHVLPQDADRVQQRVRDSIAGGRRVQPTSSVCTRSPVTSDG